MKPSEYKTKLEAVFREAGRVADRIETTHYLNTKDLFRDAAIVTDLWQQYDALLEKIQNDR